MEVLVAPSSLMQQNLDRVLRQQAALSAFGSFAFRETSLQAILNEAVHVCAVGLGVGRAKVCQYRPMQNDLLIVAGFGWHEDVVNQVKSQANETSPQGRAYITGKPVICKNLAMEKGFILPDFYAEHGIVSTIDVIVKGLGGAPFGVLEIDSVKPHAYDEHDVNFLTGFANVLAEAVATAGRVEKLQALVDEKDQLLAEKSILVEELQHRVRNNLQLVGSMLAAQVKQTSNLHDQDGLRSIQARVTALAKVYDQLLGLGLSREVDFSAYAQSLCAGLPSLQNPGKASVERWCTRPVRGW